MATYCVRIGEQTYTADSRQPLINAVPGTELVKGCLKGVCRVCRCRLISGRVLENSLEVAVQSEFLPCISLAETDVHISPAISQFHPSSIRSKTYLSENIMEVVLDVKRVFYNAKSVVTLKHPDISAVRSYSVVTLGKKSYDTLTLHVKLRPGGLFSSLFVKLSVGDRLDYSLVSPSLPVYDRPMTGLNIVSGGSGMGATLSRAQELVATYNIGEVSVYAVNRGALCDYHMGCIEALRSSTKSKIHVTNIPYWQWVSDFDIGDHLIPGVLTVSVGSDLVIGKLNSLLFCELESFG